jgi:hypothetical protein
MMHVDPSQQQVQAKGIMSSVFAEVSAQVLLLGRSYTTLMHVCRSGPHDSGNAFVLMPFLRERSL